MDRSGFAQVPPGALPVADDSVVTADRAPPYDSIFERVLIGFDHPLARLAARSPAAADVVFGRGKDFGPRGQGDDGRDVFGQVQARPFRYGDPAFFIQEMRKVDHPGIPHGNPSLFRHYTATESQYLYGLVPHSNSLSLSVVFSIPGQEQTHPCQPGKDAERGASLGQSQRQQVVAHRDENGGPRRKAPRNTLVQGGCKSRHVPGHQVHDEDDEYESDGNQRHVNVGGRVQPEQAGPEQTACGGDQRRAQEIRRRVSSKSGLQGKDGQSEARKRQYHERAESAEGEFAYPLLQRIVVRLHPVEENDKGDEPEDPRRHDPADAASFSPAFRWIALQSSLPSLSGSDEYAAGLIPVT